MVLADFDSFFSIAQFVLICSVVLIVLILQNKTSKRRVKDLSETLKKLREDDTLEICPTCGGARKQLVFQMGITCKACDGRGYVKSSSE